ncbi:MAG: hypothetical protein FWH04_01295 [Oscillospiraceae bacterium]|nr:hypothetical protein [Oscillospiraceae bacterium]
MPHTDRTAHKSVVETHRETKPDGTIIMHFERGGKVIIAPFPTSPERVERIRQGMSDAAYRISRRVAAEKGVVQ